MKCEKAQELFSDHIEGALERPMVVAFGRHLAECPSCEDDYSVFKTTYQMLETLPEVEPPAGFACDVVMKVRLQVEAERHARQWWQVSWSELFASRLPAKVFAGAVALFLGTQVVLHTPLKDVVSAGFGNVRGVQIDDGRSSFPQEWAQSKEPAMAWLHSGLAFELDPSSASGGRNVFRLLLKPKDTSSKYVRVYLMDPGEPRFDDQGIERATLVYQGSVGESGQVIPFIVGRSGDRQDVLAALIAWEHRQKKFLEAAFVPTQMSPMGAAMEGSVQIHKMELYSALQEMSAAFGAVILVNADINAVVGSVIVENGTVDDALYKLSTDVGLRWRPLGGQVYIVERRIE